MATRVLRNYPIRPVCVTLAVCCRRATIGDVRWYFVVLVSLFVLKRPDARFDGGVVCFLYRSLFYADFILNEGARERVYVAGAFCRSQCRANHFVLPLASVGSGAYRGRRQGGRTGVRQVLVGRVYDCDCCPRWWRADCRPWDLWAARGPGFSDFQWETWQMVPGCSTTQLGFPSLHFVTHSVTLHSGYSGFDVSSMFALFSNYNYGVGFTNFGGNRSREVVTHSVTYYGSQALPNR